MTHKGGRSSALTARAVGGAGPHARVSATEVGQLLHGDARAPR